MSEHRRSGSWMGCATLVAIVLSAAGCGAARGSVGAGAPVAALSLEQLDALYARAVRDSAIVQPGDALPLRPLVAATDGTVTVSTWAACASDGGPDRCRSYVPGAVTLRWDVWVVDRDELQRACASARGDTGVAMAQLLGLPAPRAPLSADTHQRQFVTMRVPITRVFRPCTDPRVDTDRCNGTTLPDALPANAPPEYYRWFARQAMSAWQLAATGQPPAGFPWTRLGYTYNWTPGAPSHYGVSEYVIPGGTQPVEVTVLSIQTARDHCRLDASAPFD